MAKVRESRRLTSGFNLGGQQAEADPLLREAFFSTAAYRALISKTDPQAFFVGRTGSGKTALFTQLEADNPEHLIRITPQDLSLPYISDSNIIRTLKTEGVHLDPLFIALWKHVLVVEVIKHRYGVNSPEAKQNFMTGLLDKIKRDRSKTEALKYLDEFQGRFWSESDMRVREITDTFETRVKNAGRIGTGISTPVDAQAGVERDNFEHFTTREEWVSRAQRIVNETQLARLNQMIKVLDEDILDSSQNFTYIVVDDLDLDWVDDSVLNDLIRCLFRAVLDLKRVNNLKVVVALRTNIFHALDFGMRTGGQEEKFRALTTEVRWSFADLEQMLNERVIVAARQYEVQVGNLRELLPTPNRTRGSALEYIFRRTLLRPRDAIAFFNLALEASTNKPRLTWDKIYAVEATYSQNRLLALRDEWKPTFAGIDQVIQQFSGQPVLLSHAQLGAILDEVAMLLGEPNFSGSSWLTPLCLNLWNAGDRPWVENYGELTRLLFDIGFLGCSVERGKDVVYKYDRPGLIESDRQLGDVLAFTVHPGFRTALEITNYERDNA